VVTAETRDAFEFAVRRKLILEISGLTPPRPAGASRKLAGRDLPANAAQD
jgi:hypothetical protein